MSSNGTRGGRAGTGIVLRDCIRDALRTWGMVRCRRRVAGLDLALLLLCGAVLGGTERRRYWPCKLLMCAVPLLAHGI